MATESAPVLTIYSRASCHLCDEMIGALRRLRGLFYFEISAIDVDGDPELKHRYGEDVPVLAHGGRELCRHRLESAAVTDYLAKLS